VVSSRPPANPASESGAGVCSSDLASGTGLSYQWFKGAGPLSGETGSSLTLVNVSAADAGSYSVVVGGTCGNPVTNTASLTVNQRSEERRAAAAPTHCRGPGARQRR